MRGVDFESWAADRLSALLGAARAMCGDRGTAEDVVQDVLAKVYTQWDRIEALDAPDAYVRRMLVNEVTSWRRKWARVVPHPEPSLPPVADPTSDLARLDELLAEIRRLPARQRVVIALRYFADLSDDEIAADIGCAPATVRVHASRALAALRVSPALSPNFEKETS